MMSAPSIRFFQPWTCRACLHQQRQTFTQRANFASKVNNLKSAPKNKKRRRILWASAGGAGVLAAVPFADDAKFYGSAVKRTGRVISTLAVCINDYRVTLKHQHDNDEDADALLKACHKRCAERTLVAIEKNGSIFIKLGQHLSSLNYLLPSEWCDTFIPLQDKCPISSIQSIRDMVKKDTGESLEDFFEEFEILPIGAASLAQVHRAKVKGTGQRVAVKVQHPSLDEWAPLDLALTKFTFATLKRWFPEYDLTWLGTELAVSLPQELDFNLEAENARKAREYFAGKKAYSELVIPKVLWAKRRILVMDYVTGHRVDDLDYLDASHIDRDEVSASLAHIFNEMIFGKGAPLHCDPHAGNIAIRQNTKNHKGFDIILYDHGLYRTLPTDLRRTYAKMWLAVIEADEPRMRAHAGELGIEGEDFELFASAITGREYNVVKTNIAHQRTGEEKDNISGKLTEGMLAQLVQLLGKMPRVMLLVLKTNDLTRSLDDSLQTRQGPLRTFLILARYAGRAVLDEQMEKLRGSIMRPANLKAFLYAWGEYTRVELKLTIYEWYLKARRLFGMQPLGI